MRVRLIVALVVLFTLGAASFAWVATRDDPTSTSADVPIGSPHSDGDPKAQCRVLALGALEMLAQGDASVLAELEASTDPSPRFIAQVARSNQTAFLAAAQRSTPARAKQQLTAKVAGDCLRAPA